METQVSIQSAVSGDLTSKAHKHVRIVSPSGHVEPSLIDAARSLLESMGWRVSEGRHARGESGRFAGTPEERTSDLLEAFTDTLVDVVICSRGGYGLQQIIDRVADGLAAIKQERALPLLVGFSDITCLHSLLGTLGVPSVHGLMCKAGVLPPQNEDVMTWLHVIEGHLPLYTLPRHPLDREGRATGRLVGGNLSVLYGLQGTPWSLERVCRMNKDEGHGNILFVEDICERHYHIDRMMNNLRLSGVFDLIDGFIIGQLTDIEDDPLMQCSVLQTVRQAVEGYDFPVLSSFPAGHGSPNFPLWLNRSATVSVLNDGSELCWNH